MARSMIKLLMIFASVACSRVFVSRPNESDFEAKKLRMSRYKAGPTALAEENLLVLVNFVLVFKEDSSETIDIHDRLFKVPSTMHQGEVRLS